VDTRGDDRDQELLGIDGKVLGHRLLGSLRRRIGRKIAGAFAALFLSCLIWALFVEPNRLVVHREDLALPKWPREQPALKVALLSDLHIGSPWWGLAHERELVQAVNALGPDVILLAGDYTINGVKGGDHIEIEPIAGVLKDLKAPQGVIAILGNHDWYNDHIRTRRALEANGIVVLENDTKTIVHQGFSVNIAGYADMYESIAFPERTFGRSKSGPIIALIHEPDIFIHDYEQPAITLAGHTHGGQVRLPLLGAPIVPSDFGQRFVAGHIVEGDRHLFVTTGIGTSIYPIRFGVPPEIALLTLHAP
jgi:predicted MPP superfamily phosphohydrolase